MCWYNKIPVTIAKITPWYVVSRDDETAMEFLEKVRSILWEGDKHMVQFTGDEKFFTGSLKEPNNAHQITFLNGCFIKSVPPTKKALGKSGHLWIDEAHRLNCTDCTPEQFFTYAVATTAETGGNIILSSSPEGIIGFFYKAIDPHRESTTNPYTPVWFPFTIWEENSKECLEYRRFVESERVRLSEAGQYKLWLQEYMALFTVTQTSFFELQDIESAKKDTPVEYEWKKTPCSVAYDYGLKISRTVITIRTLFNGELIQIFQYRAPAGFDINNLT